MPLNKENKTIFQNSFNDGTYSFSFLLGNLSDFLFL